MVRMTKANLKSDNDCRGTLHLRCQLYDKDIFGSEILDFRISFIWVVVVGMWGEILATTQVLLASVVFFFL